METREGGYLSFLVTDERLKKGVHSNLYPFKTLWIADTFHILFFQWQSFLVSFHDGTMKPGFLNHILENDNRKDPEKTRSTSQQRSRPTS